jgi:hypothetical protein
MVESCILESARYAVAQRKHHSMKNIPWWKTGYGSQRSKKPRNRRGFCCSF